MARPIRRRPPRRSKNLVLQPPGCTGDLGAAHKNSNTSRNRSRKPLSLWVSEPLAATARLRNNPRDSARSSRVMNVMFPERWICGESLR